jgi:hypothetical protein
LKLKFTEQAATWGSTNACRKQPHSRQSTKTPRPIIAATTHKHSRHSRTQSRHPRTQSRHPKTGIQDTPQGIQDTPQEIQHAAQGIQDTPPSNQHTRQAFKTFHYPPSIRGKPQNTHDKPLKTTPSFLPTQGVRGARCPCGNCIFRHSEPPVVCRSEQAMPHCRRMEDPSCTAVVGTWKNPSLKTAFKGPPIASKT